MNGAEGLLLGGQLVQLGQARCWASALQHLAWRQTNIEERCSCWKECCSAQRSGCGLLWRQRTDYRTMKNVKATFEAS